jgi:hypothetical protein
MMDLVAISSVVLLLWFLIESLSLMSVIHLVTVSIMPAGSMRIWRKSFQ